MRILFVTLSPTDLNSSAMLRNNALINGLILNNHQVDIVKIPSILSNSFNDSTIKWNENNIRFFSLKANNAYTLLTQDKRIFISSVKNKILPFARLIYKSFNLFDNTIYQARTIDIKVIPDIYYDIVISSSDPKSSHIAVDNLIKKGLNYGKWIQYWGDPLTIDITKKSIYPKCYVSREEKKIFSCADRIVYVSPITLEEQKKMFPSFSEKMQFIPIPYNKEKISNRPKGDKLKIGYFGDYDSRYRNIKPLYDVCGKMSHKLDLLIAGNSDLRMESNKNIQVSPRISQKEVEDSEATCDVLVCLLNKSGTQIPGKIYHYAATNKPVIVILDGENKDRIKEYIDKYDRYIVCNNNEESITQALFYIESSNRIYNPSPFFEPKHIANLILDNMI